MAGLGPADIDTVQLYDCFTYMVVAQLEDYGFCTKGDGGAFAASGATRRSADRCLGTRPAASCPRAMSKGCCRLSKAVRQLRRRPSSQATGRGSRDRSRQRTRRERRVPLHADSGEGAPVAGYAKPLPVPLPRASPSGRRAVDMSSSSSAAVWLRLVLVSARALSAHAASRSRGAGSPRAARGLSTRSSVVHRLYHPGFADERSVRRGVVELDEGPRLPTE